MPAIFWRTCSRVAGVVFPVSTVALFFTPERSDLELALSVTAVMAARAWIYARGRPRRGIAMLTPHTFRASRVCQRCQMSMCPESTSA